MTAPVLPTTARPDLAPSTHRAAPSPVVREVRQVAPGARRRRLQQWRDLLLLHADDTVEDLAHPAAERHAARQVLPGVPDGPLLAGTDGSLRPWGRPAYPWRVDDLRRVAPTGIGPHVLLRDLEAGTSTLVTAADGAPRWRLDRSWLALVPAGDLIIGRDLADASTVTATDLTGGAETWRTTLASPVAHVVALVGDRLWVALVDDRLVALDAATGRVAATVSHPGVDGWRRGPVAADATFVLCRAAELTVVDLDAGTVRHHVLTPTLGDPVRVGADAGGHLLVADDQARLWSFDVDDPHPLEVATTDSGVVGMEVHEGAWWVLSSSGRLTELA